MPHCAAIGCTNKSSAKSKAQLELEKHTKITFHCFPKKVDKRKIWIDQMGLTETSLPKYPNLCSRHFSSKSFDRTSACYVRLKDSAVPSIHNVHDVSDTATIQDTVVLQEISNTNVDNEVDKRTIKRERSSENDALTVDKVEEPTTEELKLQKDTFGETTKPKRSRGDETSTVDEVEELTREEQKIVIPLEDVFERKDASSQTPPQPTSADKATWVSKSFIANSPTKMRLRDVIKNQKESYERRIRVLKRATQRKEKRIATLKNILDVLKKHQRLTHEKVLRNIGTSTKDLLKRVTMKPS